MTHHDVSVAWAPDQVRGDELGQGLRPPGDKQSVHTDWIVRYPAVAAVGLRTKNSSGMQTKAVAAKK